MSAHSDSKQCELSAYYDTSEKIIERFKKSISKDRFDSQRINLRSTERLSDDIDPQKWEESLSNLNWYGPYNFDDDIIFFKTLTKTGYSTGYMLWLDLEPRCIELSYQYNGANCGIEYLFTNRPNIIRRY